MLRNIAVCVPLAIAMAACEGTEQKRESVEIAQSVDRGGTDLGGRADADDERNERIEAGEVTARVMGDMHRMNRTQIQLGRLALEKADAEDVRALAELVVRDHQRADAMLMELADRIGVDPEPRPASPLQEDTRRQRLRSLQEAQGSAFDEAFLGAIVETRDETIGMLREVQPVVDEALTAHIGKVGPILSQHRVLASNLRTPDEGGLPAA